MVVAHFFKVAGNTDERLSSRFRQLPSWLMSIILTELKIGRIELVMEILMSFSLLKIVYLVLYHLSESEG